MVSQQLEDTDASSAYEKRYPVTSRMLLRQAGRMTRKILASCLVVCPRSARPVSNQGFPELHSTAYLDALRGYAAWIVFNYHVIPVGWRHGPLLTHWPFPILFRGPSMVDVFFVISGFALSYSVLGHMHDKQPLRVLDSLASSIFRRHLRLYLPVTWVSFVTMLAISTGIAVKTEDPQVLQPTFAGNIRYWIKDTVRSYDPFPHVVSWWFEGVRRTHTAYVPQAWTIPVEFRGSLIVFLFCVAVCRMTTRARMWTTLACTAACFWWTTPYAGLFLFGMWLADRRHLRMRRQQSARETLPVAQHASEALGQEKEQHEATGIPAETIGHTGRWTQFLQLRRKLRPWRSCQGPAWCQQIPFFILGILSLWPLTAPDPSDPIGPASPFPYDILALAVPPNWKGTRGECHWLYSVGAMMLCYALDRSPLLQRPLNTQFSQFFGELSFGIYITHNLVNWIVWERVMVVWVQTHFGSNPCYQLPGYCLLSVLVLWSAEIFRRVDVGCVRLSKRVQDLFFER